jgi:hypothetical protein
MIGLGEPVLNTVLGAGPSEDVSDEAALGSLVVLDELHAIIRQHHHQHIYHHHGH